MIKFVANLDSKAAENYFEQAIERIIKLAHKLKK